MNRNKRGLMALSLALLGRPLAAQAMEETVRYTSTPTH